MLSKNTIADILTAALSTGGDFAEVFIEHKNANSISLINGKVEKSSGGIDYGVGIRIFNGFSGIYCYTNDTNYENLIKVAKEGASAVKKKQSIKVMPFIDQKIENKHKIIIPPTTYSKKEAINYLRLASKTAFNTNKLITETSCGYIDYIQNVIIANSDGLYAEDSRTRSRFTLTAIATNEKDKENFYISKGEHCGFELLKKYNFEDMGTEIAEKAVNNLYAELCPSGKMPVIIDNAFGGVIFHEACGHSLEATSIAKDASVFCGKKGSIIANEKVTAIDDGTIENEWGSLNIDDEGTKTQKNTLIKNGVLNSYLVDRLNGKKMGENSTGSSRRESYKFAPTSRMTNTYIDNGTDTTEDIFASVEYGLYAKTMGGGSVLPSTGAFNFAANEAYIIKNGKIHKQVKGATLIGKGSEILMNIDMISNNLDKAPGMCGSISGSVPTNVGQPTLRVKEITVGGRA
ncbi:MAG: TldD/PmbA family protein [Lachnospirales bacterium]